MDKENQPKCSFCGCEHDAVNGKYLIKGAGGVHICPDCVEACLAVIDQYKETGTKETVKKNTATPSKLKAYLDKYVVGQEHAKKVLSVAICNHLKYIQYKKQDNPPVELEKSNILMVGPTGSGKTYLLKTLSKILGMPFAMADATSLTQNGYVGDDPETILRKLIDDADGDIEKAQHGIIYLDEFDKLGRKGENVSITRDVSGEGVQQALLKMIEGSLVEVPDKGMRKHPMSDTMKIDTTDILFIVGGSFEGIEKIIKKRLRVQNGNAANIGFGSKLAKDDQTFNDYILNIKTEDLRKFGMLPEVLGRLPIICPLEELTEEALLNILTEPKNALVKQYQELFKQDGIQLDFSDDALKAIANKAIQMGTGARSLRSIMEETLLPHMFTLPDEKDLVAILFTKESIENGSQPVKRHAIKQESVSK